MQSQGIDWSDIGNMIEHAAKGKYTDAEMQQLALCAKRGSRKASRSNGHIVLPEPAEMAQYCHERLNRLKDDKQRDFVSDMYVITRRRMGLSLGRLGYLASIYIQIGGRV